MANKTYNKIGGKMETLEKDNPLKVSKVGKIQKGGSNILKIHLNFSKKRKENAILNKISGILLRIG